MGFWENVEYVREYRDITRKELASRAHFSINSISTGIARNSIPLADVACRIAGVLGVSVEFLVTGRRPSSRPAAGEEERVEAEVSARRSSLARSMERYGGIVEGFSRLPPPLQKAVEDLIRQIPKPAAGGSLP